MKLLTVILLTALAINGANAKTITEHKKGNRYSDLSYNYFYDKNNQVSIEIKREVASDIKTDPKILRILLEDNDATVMILAQENLSTLVN
jgi:ribosomal protein L20